MTLVIIILLMNIIALTLGLVSLILLYSLLKLKNKNVYAIFILLSVVSLIIGCNLFLTLFYALYNAWIPVFNYLFIGLQSILLFLFPMVNHMLFEVGHQRLRNIIWGTISAGVVGLSLFMAFGGSEVVSYDSFFMVFLSAMVAMLVYVLIIVLLSRRTVKDPEMRTMLGFYLFGLIFGAPFFLLDGWNNPLMRQLSFLGNEMEYIFRNNITKILFDIIGNILMIHLLLKHIHIRPFFITSEKYIEFISKNEKLTVRENEIIEYLAAGCTNEEIAKRLYISKLTVKTHIQNIYTKLGVRNRLELLKTLQLHSPEKNPQ